MPTAKDHLSPSCFSLHAQNVIRLLFNKKRTIDHCISSYYKISSCNESISTRRSSSNGSSMMMLMFFLYQKKATHVCKFIIMISSALPKLFVLDTQKIHMRFPIFYQFEWQVEIYLRSIHAHINIYVLMMVDQLNMLVGKSLISLMQSIKDESKRTKDIIFLLRNNRNNQLRSKRKNNFHTIA